MNKLGEALLSVEIPEPEGALERAAERARFVGPSRAVQSRRSFATKLAIAAVLLLGLVALSFTPPGRAIAHELGALVGIGDEPTESVYPGEDAIVIGSEAVIVGSGDATRSYPYEVVASTNKDETCVDLQFPTVKTKVGVGNCLTSPGRSENLAGYAESPEVYAAPDAFAPEGQLIVQSVIPVGAQVSMEYTTRDDEVGSPDIHTAALDQELAGAIGVEDRADFFFTVLPEGVLEGDDGSSQLSADSVIESLSRIDYRVEDSDGTVIVERPLATPPIDAGPGEPETTAAVILLAHPPQGFKGMDPFGPGGPLAPRPVAP